MELGFFFTAKLTTPHFSSLEAKSRYIKSGAVKWGKAKMLSQSRAAGKISATAQHRAPFFTRNNPLPLESEAPCMGQQRKPQQEIRCCKALERIQVQTDLTGQNWFAWASSQGVKQNRRLILGHFLSQPGL